MYTDLRFDLYAMAAPRSRNDCIALAEEILSELAIIDAHLDKAIAECESQSLLAA